MRKIILFIILVITIGVFAPIFGTYAQETGSVGTPKEGVTGSGSSEYQFLAPLPGPDGPITEFDTSNKENNPALGNYLNTMIKLFIGLCAVLAVIMIVAGGIEYMGNDVISHKADGIEKIKGAVFGLVLALASFLILQEINPQLLNTSFDIKTVELTINLKEFQIPASYGPSLSSPGTKLKIEEACPSAKAAGAATGIEPALLLSVFKQETGFGGNQGRCTWNKGSNMTERHGASRLAALKKIASQFNKNIDDIPVSCDPTGPGDSYTGGAIGPMQFMPDSWLHYTQRGKDANLIPSSATPNPWDVKDVMLVAAVHLKYTGVKGYHGDCSNNYCASVESRLAEYRKLCPAQ